MKSMTGYSYVEDTIENSFVSVEIKSYNSKYLELDVSLPNFLSSFEAFIHSFIAKKKIRAKMGVVIKAFHSSQEAQISINREIAASYINELKEVSAELDIPFNADIELLLKQSGILKYEIKTDREAWERRLTVMLNRCFHFYDQVRLAEGEALLKDIQNQASLIEEELTKIEKSASKMDEYFKESVKERFLEVVGNDYDEQRIMQEVASLLVRFTINEEVVRLKSHLVLLREELEKDGAVGKRLDFISQEIMREVNTIGAKNQLNEITPSVIMIKSCVENIREQVKNVE
jgi:TIGR00255 family protein